MIHFVFYDEKTCTALKCAPHVLKFATESIWKLEDHEFYWQEKNHPSSFKCKKSDRINLKVRLEKSSCLCFQIIMDGLCFAALHQMLCTIDSECLHALQGVIHKWYWPIFFQFFSSFPSLSPIFFLILLIRMVIQ